MEVIEVIEKEIEVIEVIERGPQGPAGAGLSTLTTQGDMLYQGATTGQRLPIGSAGQILKVNSGGTAPEWGAAPSSGVSSVSGTAPIVSSGGATPAISITAATTSAAGSMSAADKLKLDGIAAGAEVNVNADWNASSGDAQILNKPSTFTPSAHTHSLSDITDAGTAAAVDANQNLGTTDSPTFNQVTAIQFNGDSTNGASGSLIMTGAAGGGTAGSINTSGGDYAVGGSINTSGGNFGSYGGSINTSGSSGLPDVVGGSIDTSAGGGNIDTTGTGSIGFGYSGTRTTLSGSATADRTVYLPDASGTLALTSDIPANTIASTIVDAKGDLIVGTAADTVARLPVGATNGHVLTVDSAEAGGMKWAAASGGVTSVSGTAPIVSSGGTTPTISVTTGTTAGTVAAGDDSRIVGAAQKSANLSDLASASTARTNLGLGTAATAATGDFAAASHTHTAAEIDSETSSDGYVLTSDGAGNAAWEAVLAGDTVSIDVSAADILSATSGAISADDAGADRIVYWNNTSNKLAYGTVSDVGAAAASHSHAASDITNGTIDTARLGSGTANNTTYLRGDQTWATVSAGVSGSTGATDNSVLRSDGTGGSTLQASGLVVEDTVTSFTGITGDASTDIITATGSAFANGQKVRFTALTGGSGLNTTTNYYVISVSGATFQLSTTEGGSAVNFTTNITAGTLLTGHEVQTNVRLSQTTSATNSSLVLNVKGTGAFVVGAKGIDATSTGGNARGDNAVEIVPYGPDSAARIASGANSVLIGGFSHTASGTRSLCIGGGGNTASGTNAACIGGYSNTASGANSIAMGMTALADRAGARAYCSNTNSASGHRQELQFFMSRTTTNDTATEILTDEYTSTARITIPSGKVMGGIVCVTGSKSDGSKVAFFTRGFVIKNVGGTTTLLSAPTIGSDYEDDAATDITVEANDTNDALRVLVKGIASETWRWTGWVHCTEHLYGT